jgi:ATP-dependent DNA ligase
MLLPRIIKPMLAKKADRPFDSDAHIFEIKWDGIRCLAFIEAARIQLQSRQLTDLTVQFPELACLKELPGGTVLDGELVALEHGKPSLRAAQQRVFLQNRHRIGWLSRTKPVTYMVFDLPYLNGKSLMASPFCFRREALQQLIERIRRPGVLVPEGVRGHGRQLFEQVVHLGLEGIMAKRLDGPYLPGRRSPYWLKIKPTIARRLESSQGIRTGIAASYEIALRRNGTNPAQPTGSNQPRRGQVELWALCGPGDDALPVITIILEGEANARHRQGRRF